MKSPKRAEHNSVFRLTSMRSHIYQWPQTEISPNPDAEIHDRELAVFSDIISGQEQWSRAHVLLAAKLAQATIASDTIWMKLQTEGFEIEKEGRGGSIIKAKSHWVDIHAALVSDIIRFSQKLGLSYANPANGDPRTRSNQGRANPARVSRPPRSDESVDWVAVAKSEGV